MERNNLPLVLYKKICPIDGKEASLKEIVDFGLCYDDFQKIKKGVWDILESEEPINELGNFKEEYLIYKKLKNFKNFFKENLGYYPFRFQLYFAKRVFNKESFSILAPTGIGKTTFGVAISNFIDGKVYYLVPSKILLDEIERKLGLINSFKKVLAVKKPEDKEKLIQGDFDILVTTSNFLHKNFDILPKNFDLVFIDDADSLIRQPKNIDKVLKLIGFNEKEIEKALEIIDKKRKAKNREDYNSISKLDVDLKNKGIIVAASATLTPKTKRIALFRELLGFEIGSSTSFLRNIEEIYEEVKKENLWKRALFWIKKLKKGGFVFLSDDFNKDDLKKFLEFLEKNGVSAVSYEKFNKKYREKFINQEIEVVVGFSNIRNPLTRGIDLPHRIRYSIFVGVPKFKIPLKVSFSPMHLFLLSINLKEILPEEEREKILRNIKFLRKISFLKEEEVLANENLIKKLEPIKNIFEKILAEKDLIKEIEKHPELSFEFSSEGIYLLVSDPRGYLQASGRTSRLFPLGMTKGLAIILTENIKILNHLKEKLKILGYESEFKKIEEANLEEIIKKIDEDRNLVEKVLKGEEFVFKDPIETILVIVESPTKSRTISNFFGKPARKNIEGINFYEVSLGSKHLFITSSLGHFVDLVHKEGYYGVEKNSEFIPIFQPLRICLRCGRALDEEKFCPVCKYKEFNEKENLIKVLRKIAFQVDKIYLATDPDTEGEKIAFDLFAYLYPYNRNIERIELHEITRREFLKRIQEPREINYDLVKAQLLRRISDRWIGFKLSEEIQEHFENLNLSAGRVQTPVLGWVLEKEKKLKEKHYLITAYFNEHYVSFYSEDQDLVKKLKKRFKNKELKIEVRFLEKKEVNLNPLPPYETGSILKDASMFFKFSSNFTMKLLQDLFEQGLITYHRTDSTHISSFGQNLAKEYLEKIHLGNLYSPRSWGKVKAHEGIRPTKPLDVQDIIESLIETGQKNLNQNHLKLYGLIFNRFLSSQVKPAKLLQAEALIKLDSLEKKDSYWLEILKENSLKFFKNAKIVSLKEGIFEVNKLLTRKVSKEFRFTQGEIIDLMKKRGLGRPSTYATILQTLLDRNYVISRSGFLIPTNWGEKIYEYLIKNHKDLISEDFTVKLEENMDKVERGEMEYQKILNLLFERIFNES